MNHSAADGAAGWERPGGGSGRVPRSRLDQALTVARRSTERRHPYDWEPPDGAAVVGIFEDVEPPPLAPAREPEPPAPAPPPPADPAQLVADLNPPAGFGGPAPRRGGPDFGLGRDWGSTWRWTAQGWVDQDAGPPTWRPVVTTTVDFPEWEVDTYLGLVAGESAVHDVDDAQLLGRSLGEGRSVAMQGMIDAALARGAHAVVGASVDYTPIGARVVVTATGTAVTLRDR